MKSGMKLAFVLFFFMLPQAVYGACLIDDDEQQAWNILGSTIISVVADCAETGFDFSAELASGIVPFHRIVAVYAEPEAVRIALEAGADPNTTSRWGSPAFVDMVNFSMTEKDDPDTLAVLRLLGEAGADFSRPDNHGQTALAMASGSGEIETVRVLLDYGADLNGYERTALFHTVFGRCSPAIGELLIEYGARIDPMPADQVARMLEEARTTCGETDNGRAWAKQLHVMAETSGRRG